MSTSLYDAIQLYKELHFLPQRDYRLDRAVDKIVEYIIEQSNNLKEETQTRPPTTPNPNDDDIPF